MSSRESGAQMYSLEIGPCVDIAFLTMCASTIDLLTMRATFSPIDHLLHWVSCCTHQDDDGVNGIIQDEDV